MTNNAKKIAEEIDFVTEGFAKVPVVENPPHIKWGDSFKAWDIKKQNDYLMKFAEAMNHAADILQQERDKLGELLEKKEEQLIQMQERVEASDKMLISEITRMNEYRHEAQQHSAQQAAKIRELET